MERGWTKGGHKELHKSFWKETCCEGDQEKINQKTTRKTDERKTEKRPINKNTWSFSDRVFVLKKKEAFKRRRLKREKRRRKHKGPILTFERTNKQETLVFFSKKRDCTNGNNTKTCLCVKKYVTRENKKGEKNDDQTKQSLKKEIRKMGATEGETFKNENRKRQMFKNKLEYIKKVKFRNKDTCKDK